MMSFCLMFNVKLYPRKDIFKKVWLLLSNFGSISSQGIGQLYKNIASLQSLLFNSFCCYVHSWCLWWSPWFRISTKYWCREWKYCFWYWLYPLKQRPMFNFIKMVNQFHATSLFRYLLKTSENQRFSNVFRGYRKRPVAWHELMNTEVFTYVIKKYWAD